MDANCVFSFIECEKFGDIIKPKKMRINLKELRRLYRKLRYKVEISENPSMFKLNVDCVLEICEWLSIKDLIALAQTCQTMNCIVGEYFNRNYVSACITCNENRIINMGMDNKGNDEINQFSEFIKKVTVWKDGKNDQRFKYIASNCKSLRQIKIESVTLSADRIVCIKEILRNVEMLEFVGPIIHIADFYENILKYCDNLTTLSLQYCKKEILAGPSNAWMLKKYPKLKHFQMTQYEAGKIHQFGTFLENNLQLESLAINSSVLRANEDTFLKSTIKLQNLAIKINFVPTRNFLDYFNLLNRLYSQGFYKRLHLYVYSFDSKTINQMKTLQALTDLFTFNCTLDKTVYQSLINIRELILFNGQKLNDVQFLAKNLVNLQRFYIYKANYDDIRFFIRHTKHLRTIAVRESDDKIFNLSALNRDRAQLLGARKITIFMQEQLYLRTKFATSSIQLQMIEIKMLESVEWDHYFF